MLWSEATAKMTEREKSPSFLDLGSSWDEGRDTGQKLRESPGYHGLPPLKLKFHKKNCEICWEKSQGQSGSWPTDYLRLGEKTCLSGEPLPWSRATRRMVRFRRHRLCKSAVPARSTWGWGSRGAVRARSGKVMDSPATDLAADTCRAHSDQACRWPLERPCKTQSQTKSWEHILELCSPPPLQAHVHPFSQTPRKYLRKEQGMKKRILWFADEFSCIILKHN